MLKKLSEQIKNLRKKEGWSKTELANRLGVSPQLVGRWESGASIPTVEQVVALAVAFDVTANDILSFSSNKEEASALDGMESLTELYKIGCGPSSSHTMGPEKAVMIFKERYPNADCFKAILYGSLAKTGEGHGTDVVVKKTFLPLPCEVVFDYVKAMPHPNTLDLIAYSRGEEVGRARVFSVGGGRICFEGSTTENAPIIYSLRTFKDIAEYCTKKGIRIWEFALENEGEGLWQYMQNVWEEMKNSIHNGLQDEGVLPGGLNVQKKANYLYNLKPADESAEIRENRLVSSYAFAVSEQNACGGRIVTAPTCGASGVVPAVLYYEKSKNHFTDEEIIKALITGGIIGNLIKTNASISGAECGCQAEVGSACAMAAAALAELFHLSLDKIEYAAEVAIEHHLGLTCDPICGLVQIPCIERNAVAAMRAINAVNLSSFLSMSRKMSLDKVIVAMRETGRDLAKQYRETSEGGLAKIKINTEL